MCGLYAIPCPLYKGLENHGLRQPGNRVGISLPQTLRDDYMSGSTMALS